MPKKDKFHGQFTFSMPGEERLFFDYPLATLAVVFGFLAFLGIQAAELPAGEALVYAGLCSLLIFGIQLAMNKRFASRVVLDYDNRTVTVSYRDERGEKTYAFSEVRRIGWGYYLTFGFDEDKAMIKRPKMKKGELMQMLDAIALVDRGFLGL